VQVYGHRSFPLDLRIFLPRFEARLAALPVHPSDSDVLDLFIDFAEAEAAVADAYCPQQDDEVEALTPWRDSLHALAAALCAATCGGAAPSRGAPAARAIDTCRALVARLSIPETPTVTARVAEGFSCFALYPEQYSSAALRLAQMFSGEPVVCVGIRSIGSALAAVVAASLRGHGLRVDTRTIRPRGHPFDRNVALGPQLTRFFAVRRQHRFVVVDEGPGMSGSSFASVVGALERVGVDRSRIALVPSWMPDVGTLRSDAARQAFASCQVVIGASPLPAASRQALGSSTPADYSAGLWRRTVMAGRAAWPAAHPQHERVKFVDSMERPRTIARFAGLGRHGRGKLERAEAMYEAGFGPRPLGLHRGLLLLEWLDGAPLLQRSALVDADVERVADYLAFLRRRFTLDTPDSGEDLASMLRENARESLWPSSNEWSGPPRSRPEGGHYRHTANALDRRDAELLDRIERLIEARPIGRASLVAVDGRLLPHEWIAVRQQGTLMKIDALDHHADDFLPGCRDVAWDLAGALVDMPLSAAQRGGLLRRYIHETGDRAVDDRLPFFTAAYLAYRVGYTSMAAESLGGSADGERFTKARERYRRSLAAHGARRHRPAAR
jgi:hypothetical protein